MVTVYSPHGQLLTFEVREDTNDDALVHGVLGEDEYDLRSLSGLTGWALDVGAHIGSVAVALAADHPDLRIIAVEPVPDNAELVRRNAELNGFGDRIFVEEAGAAGTRRSKVSCAYGYLAGDHGDAGYVSQNRYIGNIWRRQDLPADHVAARPVTIASLAEAYGVERFRFCKIDCEGCEWRFLRRDADRIDEIVGEWHDRRAPSIVRLLEATHEVSILRDDRGSGIFRALRRN